MAIDAETCCDASITCHGGIVSGLAPSAVSSEVEVSVKRVLGSSVVDEEGQLLKLLVPLVLLVQLLVSLVLLVVSDELQLLVPAPVLRVAAGVFEKGALGSVVTPAAAEVVSLSGGIDVGTAVPSVAVLFATVDAVVVESTGVVTSSLPMMVVSGCSGDSGSVVEISVPVVLVTATVVEVAVSLVEVSDAECVAEEHCVRLA
jgi:hypothetical protein